MQMDPGVISGSSWNSIFQTQDYSALPHIVKAGEDGRDVSTGQRALSEEVDVRDEG